METISLLISLLANLVHEPIFQELDIFELAAANVTDLTEEGILQNVC